MTSQSQASDVVGVGRRVAVLTAAALCNVLTTFQFAAFGSYYVVLIQHFDVSLLAVGWIGSLQIGMTYVSGFLIAPWLRHVGGRKIIRISGVVLCVGYLLSSQATSIFTLFFTYGIICGIGTSMLYLAAMVQNQTTFSQNVVFAHTVASLGFSGGTALAGIIVPRLLVLLGWRGLMAIEAAVMLHTIPLSYCFINCRMKQTQSLSFVVIDETQNLTQIRQSKLKLKNAAEMCLKLTVRSFDFRLFLSGIFLIFCLARIGGFGAFYSIIAHTPGRAVHEGLSLQQGTQLVSAMSFATFASRPFLAALTFKYYLNEVTIAAVCAPLAALATTAVALFSDNYPVLVTLYALNGLALGTSMAMMSPMVPHLFGQENLARNQASAMLVDGFSIILTPPLIGALVDVSKDYFVAFLSISAQLALCSVAIIYVYVMQVSPARDVIANL